jgi:hypothetical protein
LNASPAPVVSTTLPAKAAALSAWPSASTTAPRRPRLITVRFASDRHRLQADVYVAAFAL